QLEANQANQTNPVAPGSEAQPSGSPAASPPGAPVAATPPRAPAATAPATVDAALTASPRVMIDTPSVGGSIALKGGKIDDIVLKDYHETVEPKSPNVRLFSPPGAPDAYFAETGFVSQAGAKTPGLDAVWPADRQTLTPTQP